MIGDISSATSSIIGAIGESCGAVRDIYSDIVAKRHVTDAGCSAVVPRRRFVRLTVPDHDPLVEAAPRSAALDHVLHTALDAAWFQQRPAQGELIGVCSGTSVDKRDERFYLRPSD
ncbi:MAG TPA: hypothetical protein EYH34_03185 [Planctomycetes bacterium]|nr:hypothetical protein [Planctomycetota bacterium]